VRAFHRRCWIGITSANTAGCNLWTEIDVCAGQGSKPAVAVNSQGKSRITAAFEVRIRDREFHRPLCSAALAGPPGIRHRAFGASAPLDIAVIAIYFGIVIWIGFYLKGRSNTSEEFFMAGREMTAWIAGLSFVSATSARWS